jgi:hypothetical protein
LARISSKSDAYTSGYIARYSASASDGTGGLARCCSHSVQHRSPAVQEISPAGDHACSAETYGEELNGGVDPIVDR